jgi:hypothetical protein
LDSAIAATFQAMSKVCKTKTTDVYKGVENTVDCVSDIEEFPSLMVGRWQLRQKMEFQSVMHLHEFVLLKPLAHGFMKGFQWYHHLFLCQLLNWIPRLQKMGQLLEYIPSYRLVLAEVFFQPYKLDSMSTAFQLYCFDGLNKELEKMSNMR